MKFYRACTTTENTKKTLNGCNLIEIIISYDLGGYRKPRGYYANVYPAEDRGAYVVTNGGADVGKIYALNEVSRKSKKAELEAIEIVKNNIDMLFSSVADQCNLKIDYNIPIRAEG